jgi:hypothetical protein
MRPKEAFLPALCVILTALPGCDNVQWGGVEFALEAPDPPPSALRATESAVDPEVSPAPLVPLATGPLLYLVERQGSGNEATILPLAEFSAEGFLPLPSPDETPDMVARFPLGRWEAGTELLLLDRGRRAGTLLADGTASLDEETCQPRPLGRGRLELRPEAQSGTRFLAVRKADLGRAGLQDVPAADLRDWPAYPSQGELRAEALTAGRFTIQRAGVPWPPSIPDILVDQRGVSLPGGETGLAATFVFGGDMALGRVPASGYGLFVLARPAEAGAWTPIWIWHQMVRDGKAFPRVLAEGGLHPDRGPELLLEVFGEDDRWLALLGEDAEGWSLLYQDPCGDPPARGAARPWS